MFVAAICNSIIGLRIKKRPFNWNFHLFESFWMFMESKKSPCILFYVQLSRGRRCSVCLIKYIYKDFTNYKVLKDLKTVNIDRERKKMFVSNKKLCRLLYNGSYRFQVSYNVVFLCFWRYNRKKISLGQRFKWKPRIFCSEMWL